MIFSHRILNLLLITILLSFFSHSSRIFPLSNGPGQRKTDLVNLFIGVEDGGGAAFAGTCLPFGIVRLGSDTLLSQNPSGYVSKASGIRTIRRLS